MKKLKKYSLFFAFCVFFVILDCCFFKEISILKNLRLSLVFCLCALLAQRSKVMLVICAVLGIISDLFSLSFPYFSLLYLYISLGCVWCKGMFLNIKYTTVFFVCAALLFLFFCSMQILDMFFLKDIVSWQEVLCDAFVFSLTNAVFSPLIYGILKRLDF